MLKIKGEIRGEYLHLRCEKCGKSVSFENLRWVGGVPHAEVVCSTCDERHYVKLHPPTWVGILGPPDDGSPDPD